jgi:hypothetical protein
MGFRKDLIILIPQSVTAFYMFQNRQKFRGGGLIIEAFFMILIIISFP